MKKLILSISVLSLLFFACNNGESADGEKSADGKSSDAKAFCECFEDTNSECEKEMEKLEEALKKDSDRYEKFASEAREMCPDAEKYIKRMN